MSGSRRSMLRGPRPAWGRLYAVFLLAVVLLVAAHLGAHSPARREVAEGLVSLLVIGAMALWVRANRLALACREETSEDRETLRVWVAYSPEPVPRGDHGLAGIQRN